MDNKEKLAKLIIKNPSISLKEGEVCFYQGTARSYNVKNVVTGYKSAGLGTSIRVAKGFSIRTGGGGRQAIREDVSEEYDATFYITNMRLILLASKYGFEIKTQDVTSIKNYIDGLEVYSKGKSYMMKSNDIPNILKIINLINNGYNEQEGLPINENTEVQENVNSNKNYQTNIEEKKETKTKKSWSEMTQKEKWKRIGIIAAIILGIIVIFAIFGGEEIPNEETPPTTNNSPAIFQEYEEINDLIVRYNSLANTNLAKNDFQDKSNYTKDYVTITIDNLYVEIYSNSTGTWIELSKPYSATPTEDNYENQFLLFSRALNSSLSLNNANAIWLELTTNEYDYYNPYVSYGMECSYYDVNSEYKLIIKLD